MHVVRLVRNISPRDMPGLQFVTTKTFANFYISEIIAVAQMTMLQCILHCFCITAHARQNCD